MASVNELISNNIEQNGRGAPVNVRICADGLISTAQGAVTEQADCRILTYREPGMDDSRTELRFAPDSVQMKRTGTYSTEMHFAPGKPFHGSYGTPFGRIGFQLQTKRLTVRETAQGWAAALHYVLHMDGSTPEQHRLELTVTAKSKT